MSGAGLLAQLAALAYNPQMAEWAEGARHDIEHSPDGNSAFSLFAPAARGNLEAQRRLSILGVLSMHMVGSGDQMVPLAEGLAYGRQAAIQGDQSDRYRLVKMLALAATVTGGVDFAAEALAWLEALANEGHEEAAQLLASHAGTERPEAMEIAKAFHGDMTRYGMFLTTGTGVDQ